jgi:hypothetical protein
MNTTEATEPNVEKVGVLLVHGIGEQCQFEHLEGEARNIVTALKKSLGETQTIQVEVNSFPAAAFGAKQETWHDGGRAPVMVEVYDDKKLTQIYFHQVWWADLDEPTNLWSEIRFWLWGLSLWTIDGNFQRELPGSVTRMVWPNNVQKGQKTISGWARARLFWVSLVILLILPVLSLLNFVLRRVLALKIPPPDILAQFIGDVKLFQQEKRIGKGPLHDFGSRSGAPLKERLKGLTPRVTLRRRMIRGLVEMALNPYDQWYILAHSQGTVLAFNGIMETAQSLPNYLTEDLWRRCKAQSLIREVQNPHEALTAGEQEKMEPFFPSWRDKKYILDRKELFKNLRGLLTYGSPLSKFAALWPVIVPLNKDECVFHEDFQWLNVYDPTDPVAGATQPFQSSQSSSGAGSNYKAPEPIDIAYKANRFHLLSHVEYLSLSKGDDIRLVDIVAGWLVEGNLNVSANKDSLTVQQGQTLKCLSPSLTLVYKIARVATWILAALFIGSLLSVLISAVPQLSSFFQPITSFVLNLVSPWLQLNVMPLWLKLIFTAFLGGISYILLAGIVVLLTGIVVKVLVKDLGKL